MPWVQDTGGSRGRNPHLAFDHRDARAFDAAVDCEHRARHRYPAIRRSNVQMSGLPLGGLHYDVAAAELNRSVMAVHGGAEFRAFVHPHHRAFGQAQLTPRAPARTYTLPFGGPTPRPSPLVGVATHPHPHA